MVEVSWPNCGVAKRCGECAHAGVLCVKPRGSWGNGEKETVKCGVKNNPFLPESIRFGNSVSARHLANDCPLWVPTARISKECRRCVENNYGMGLMV